VGANGALGVAKLMIHHEGEFAIVVIKRTHSVDQAIQAKSAAPNFRHDIIRNRAGVIDGEDGN
jgi:hypothetical protein